MERLGGLTDINLQIRDWARTQRYTHVVTCKGQKGAFNPHEVGTVVGYESSNVGVGNQTLVPHKRSRF